MKKLGMLLIMILGFLTGCTPQTAVKTQIKTNASSLIKQIAIQKTALKTINQTVADFPATYQNESRDATSKPLQTTRGPVKKLLDQRKDAFKKVASAQAQIARDTNQLTKYANQNIENLPQSQLTKVATSLKLTKLDHQTLTRYYDEMTRAEDDFFAAQSNSKQSEADIENELAILNQYYSSLAQQIDIINANLSTVTSQTNALLKAISQN